MKKYSRIKVSVSLDAIAHNFEAMHKNIKEETKIIAVIKADGYGHGAVPIAHMVEPYEYIGGFATATVEEALELREAGIRKPIIILGYSFEEYYEEIVNYELRPAVFQEKSAQKLSETAARLGKNVSVHLALDTGMSRIGFLDNEESLEIILRIAKLPNLEIEGMFTHFARADETDKTPAYVQLKRYNQFADALEKKGIQIPIKHCSNSAGIIRMPEANMDMVRAGITIYGIYPSDEVEREIIKLQPAMEIKSHITYIKEVGPDIGISYGATYVTKEPTMVATIPVGYADGYPRSLSNKGYVLIHGKKAPILGRVCMDQMMVDVTQIPEAKELDEVTLMGRDHGVCLSVEELGRLSGRFSYEFVCDISKRVPRIYVQDGKVTECKNWF